MAVSSLRQWTLPPELWLMVFREFNDSDPDSLQARDTLKSISLTCRAFRRFTLPLLCETFVLRPQNLIPPDDRTDREIRRLDFYASDRIVLYVYHLKVQRCIKDSGTLEHIITTPAMPENSKFLVLKFFDMLPRFTNARSLTCDEIDIGLHAFKNLSALPCLRSISLTNCNVSALSTNDSLRPLRLHIFRADYYRWDATEPPRWLTLMDPSSLQVLLVHISRDSSAWSLGGFFRDMPSAGLFPSLHTLNLTVAPDVITLIVQILSNTPALRRLTMILRRIMRGEDQNAAESPARHLVPYLEVYNGSHQLLPHILRRPTYSMKSPSSSRLRRLNLYPGAHRYESESLHALVNTLRSLCPTQLRHLTHFRASITWVDCIALENLCALFPELRELMITSMYPWRPFTHNVGCGLFFLLVPKC